MSLTFQQLEVVPRFNKIQVLEIDEDGKNWRRILYPDMDVSSEVQEIKDKAEELWTDEVKASWTKHQEEQQAKMEAE
tara:strand:- start:42 stop:272 length:231 start_codon:yes stop_codon:yes gene_type:complete